MATKKLQILGNVGQKPLIVEVTTKEDGTLEANYTCNEIIEFHKQGRTIILRDFEFDYPLTEASEMENEDGVETGVMFGNIGGSEESNYVNAYYMYNDSNEVTRHETWLLADVDGKLDKPGNDDVYVADNCKGGVLARLSTTDNPFWMAVSGGDGNVVANSMPKYDSNGQLTANYQTTDGQYITSKVATEEYINNRQQVRMFNIYVDEDGSLEPDDMFKDVVDVVENTFKIPALHLYPNENYKTITTVTSVERDDDGNPSAVIFGNNEYIWRSDESFEKIEPQEKSYELIETITVSEEGLYAIERNAFPDGTPYNLSAVIVKAEFYYPMASSYGTRVDFYSNGTKIADVVLSLAKSAYTTTVHASTAVYKMVPNKVTYDVIGAQSQQGAAMALMYPTNGNYQTIPTSTRVTAINYALWGGETLPVGTKITIWGVQEDA